MSNMTDENIYIRIVNFNDTLFPANFNLESKIAPPLKKIKNPLFRVYKKIFPSLPPPVSIPCRQPLSYYPALSS